MDFLHTMVRVTDLDKSLQFYCEGLGLKELRRVNNEGGRFTLVFLASKNDIDRAGLSGDEMVMPSGLPMIELTYNWPAENGTSEEYGEGRNFGHMAFRVDDVYATCQHLSDMGVTIHRPPRDGYMAFVRSPDNISIELLQSGPRKAPAEPWASLENIGHW
ncbi:MAG: lactoylglutathione lyase [Litorimonas sp.]